MCLAVTVAGTDHLDTQWQAPLGEPSPPDTQRADHWSSRTGMSVLNLGFLSGHFLMVLDAVQARAEEDHGCSKQAERNTNEIRNSGPDPLHGTEPNERRDDIDPSVSCVRPSCEDGVDPS